MLIYLDNCVFNRPFDNQGSLRVRLETESKLDIQEKVKQGVYALAWSYILDYENAQNPFFDKRYAIEKWASIASIQVNETENIITMAEKLQNSGIRTKDALHFACAVDAGASYFISTDDRLLKKLEGRHKVQAINPIDFVRLNDD